VALTVAERAVFMEKGEVRFTGSTADLLGRSDILRSVFLRGSAGGRSRAYGGSRRYTPDPVANAQHPTVLEVQGLHKHYGGIGAVNGVDLVLHEGEILGLIGPNGAGKTTLFDLISGFVAPNEGRVLLFGEDVTGLSPDARAALGMHRSFQDARLFPSLTVTENVSVALEKHLENKSALMAALRLPNVRRAEERVAVRADRLIRLMGLDELRDKFVRELSTGSRRVLDLACVMATDPEVLLLDEPSSGIAQRETEELGPLLQRIKYETGCSILIIEHDMPLISAVSDELVALDLGAVVTRGAPADVLAHPKVVESYLGTSEDVIQRSGHR
jgi:branched-chain amino acid transport system ATP-binding protein